MRLRADFWVAAYIRRCEIEGASAYLRRRGSAEAGAVLVKLDCLDGRAGVFAMTSFGMTSFGMASPEQVDPGIERRFARLHGDEWIDPLAAEEKLRRESKFDPDVWIVEVEDRAGRSFLDLT